MTKNIIFKIYAYFMAALTAICAACLIFSCVSIYKGSAFSPEAVALAFARIALPVYVFIFGLLVGVALWIIAPETEVKTRGTVDARVTAKKIRARLSGVDGAAQIIARERRIRIISLSVASLPCLAAAIYPIIHILNRSNFPNSDVNAEILAATLTAVPFVIVCFVALAVYSKLESDSLVREMSELKALGGKSALDTTGKTQDNRTVVLCIRIAVAVIAVTFIALGIINGGANDVLQKAIRICTECIGLG